MHSFTRSRKGDDNAGSVSRNRQFGDCRAAMWRSKIHWLRDRRNVSRGSEEEDRGADIPACGAGRRLACRMIDLDQAGRLVAPQLGRLRPTYPLEAATNFSSDFTKLPGNGRTRSKMRSAIGFAVW